MSLRQLTDQFLVEIPKVLEAESESILRRLRIFGPKGHKQYLSHLLFLKTGRPWFALGGTSDARFFTQLKKQASPVKNPRSIQSSQNFIAFAKNDGFLFTFF